MVSQILAEKKKKKQKQPASTKQYEEEAHLLLPWDTTCICVASCILKEMLSYDRSSQNW